MNRPFENIQLLKDLKSFSYEKRVDVLGPCPRKIILRDMLIWAGAKMVRFYETTPNLLRGEVCLYAPEIDEECVREYQAVCELRIADEYYDFYDKWHKSEKACLDLLHDFSQKFVNPHLDAHHIGVLIQPWYWTSVPWFMLIWACVLATKEDYRVTLIINDLGFGPEHDFNLVELDSVIEVSKEAEKFFKVIRYSNYLSQSSTLSEKTKADIIMLSKYSRIHDNFGETVEDSGEIEELFRQQYEREAGLLPCLLDENLFGLMLLFNGLSWSPGLLFKIGNEKGIACMTLECSGENILFCIDGLSVHLQDTPLIAEYLLKEDLQEMLDKATDEMHARKNGTMICGIRHSKTTWDMDSGFVLILPNVTWDTAILGLADIFEGTMEWIDKTVYWLLKNTGKNIIIRRHPAERLMPERSRDDMAGLLEQYRDSGRVVYLPPDNPINTYSLIEKAGIVLVRSGTPGLEATAWGKPVITCCDTYYSKSGCVWKANSVEEYHKLLMDGVNGKLCTNDKQKQTALLYYYITQCCNAASDFTCMPSESEKWLFGYTAQKLLDDPGVTLVLESILTKTPLRLLQHRLNQKLSKLC